MAGRVSDGLPFGHQGAGSQRDERLDNVQDAPRSPQHDNERRLQDLGAQATRHEPSRLRILQTCGRRR